MNNTTDVKQVSVPKLVKHKDFINNIQQIQAGSNFSGFLSKQGVLYMCGCNHHSQLGQNSAVKAMFIPIVVPYIKECIISFSLGLNHTVVIAIDKVKKQQYIYGFGNNEHGQLALNPQQYSKITQATRILAKYEDKIYKIKAGFHTTAFILSQTFEEEEKEEEEGKKQKENNQNS